LNGSVHLKVDISLRLMSAELASRSPPLVDTVGSSSILDEKHRVTVYHRDGQLDRQRGGAQRRALHDVESALAV